MATVRDVCTRAARRLRLLDASESLASEDGAFLLSSLNDMLHAWAAVGVNIEHQDYALNDSFVFFVPPVELSGETLAALDYRGAWNASTNSPALVSSAGTEGHLYRVTTAGATTLDLVASWAVDDYAVFDGSVWLKGKPSRMFDRGVADLLAIEVAGDYSKPVSQGLAIAARAAWISIQAEFIRVDPARADSGLLYMPSRRYYGVLQ